MPVFLDVKSRLDTAAAMLAAREAKAIFSRAGDDIGHGLGKSLSNALNVIDGSKARSALRGLQTEYAATAAAEEAAAARMVRSVGMVEVAQRRLNEVSAKYTADSSRAAAAEVGLADARARAARAQRDHVDAMVAAEGAHKNLSTATAGSAMAATRAAQVFNGVGVAAVAGFGAAMFETTKKAGDFQASQQRLVASAGEDARNLKTVSDGILNLAGQVGYSAQSLSNAMYTVEKAGYRGADGVNVLKAAAQGAKSENAELGEVLSGLTTSMNDFGYGPASAADVMSKMVAATGMAKTNFQEFSGALHSVEPIAAAVGQNLDAAGKQHLMADVYGSLAQVTQSGTSPDQAAQNMARAFTSLANPTQQMRDEMGQFGLNAEEVSQKLGERGLSGTMQYLSDTIRQHMSPQGQVVVDTMYKSAQASDAADKIFKSLPPEAQKVAQSIKDGTLSYKEFRKTRGGLDVEQANELQQWVSLNNRITGYSNALKSGQGDVQTYMQALRLMLGNQESARIAVQLTGENTDATNQKVKAIDQTTREHDGTVKGFNETQETLNAKLADAKAAFGAAAIEMGTVFVPAATKVAEVAKWIGDEMAKHPGIMHTVIDVLGTLGGAWLGIKALNIADTVLMPITRGLVGVVAGEEAATAAAGGLSGALRGLAGAVPYVAAAYAGIEATNAATGNRSNVDNRQNPNGWWGTGFGVLGGPLKGLFGRAGGGPLSAPGPKGKDSALFWGADGEHVLTHDDVQAMGGHSGVYAFRNALHREGGGAVGPDVYAAHSMAGTKYSQGNRDDCSGMVGRVVGSALGIPNAGLPTTQNMGSWLEALGFKRGVGGPGTISVGWYNHGSSPNDGHAAMTLSDGENAESGGSHGDFRVGSGAAGANSPQFDQHMYLPNLYGQGAASGGAGGFSPFGGGAGGGFGGGSPEKVAAAQETVRHLDAEIANAEQRKSELKDDAKQSQRDRLDEEIRHLHIERDQAQERLQKAEQGTFHRGGAGMGLGGIQFGAPLAEGFGLSGGVKGVGEWITSFLANRAIGPIEGAMLGNAIRAGQFGGAPAGGYADLGEYGTPLPQTGVDAVPGVAGLGAGPGEGQGDIGSNDGTPASPPAAPAPRRSGPALGDWDKFLTKARDKGVLPVPVTPFGQYADPKNGNCPIYMKGGDQFGGFPVPHFSTGALITGSGARGQDSVLSMVAPGEFVEQTSAVDKYGTGFMSALNAGRIDPSVLPHFGTGGMPYQQQPPPKTPAAPQPHEGSGKPPGPGGAAAGKGAAPEVSSDDRSGATPAGVAKPGASQRLADEGLPASQGIGFSGGVIGAAEGAASSAGSFFAPGSGAGMQVAFQDLNRTAGYVGQLGGIAAEGFLSTLIPSDSPLSQWGNTLPGKLLTGVAGVRPSAPNTAGQTQQPLEPTGGSGTTVNGHQIGSQFNILGPMNVNANDPAEFHQQLMAEQAKQGQQMTRQYPSPYGVPR